MEEMDIGGKKYLSSKKAAQVTGYAKDYVGQLCREGRVEAKLIGRSWYVSEESIKAHRFGEEESKEAKQDSGSAEVDSVATDTEREEATEISEISNKQATWESPTYVPEVSEEVVPLVEKRDRKDTASVDIDAMQSAWKEWFERLPAEESKDIEQEVSVSRLEEETPIETVESIVPIHRVDTERKAPQSQEMDVIPAPKATQSSVYVPKTENLSTKEQYATEEKRVERVSDTEYGSNLTIKALCIALIMLIVSVTSIALGVRTPFAPTSDSNIPVIDYLEGQTHI